MAKFNPKKSRAGNVAWLESFVGYWKDDILQEFVAAKEHFGTTDLVAILLAEGASDDPAALTFWPREGFLKEFQLDAPGLVEVKQRIADPNYRSPNPGFQNTFWVFASKKNRIGCVRLHFTEYTTDGVQN